MSIAHTENEKSALLIATMASFLTPFLGSSLNIALPSIGKEYAMTAVLLSWVATGYLLSAAMFLVPIGKVADIYGRKKIFKIGIWIDTISCSLSIICPNGIALIILRIFQGIGGALIFSTGVAILTSVFPPKERGRVLGINVAAVYTGLSLGPFVGGFLTQHFGWRSIFGINILIGISVIYLITVRLKGEWAESKGEKFDLAGSIIYSVTFVALLYGFTRIPSILGIVLVLFGLAGLGYFIYWESKQDSPILHIDLFRKTNFALSNLAALINYSATFGVTFLLSLYLQYAKGLNPQTTGIIMVSQPIVMALVSPYAGKLSDRIEPGIIASIGMGLTAIGLLLFIFLEQNTPIYFILCGLLLLGLGFALFSSPNINAIMSSVEKKYYGIAAGTMGTMRLTGQVFSMGIATLLFTLHIGNVQIKPENLPAFLKSVQSAFLIFSLLCFAGIWASLTRGKVREIQMEP